MQKISSFQGDRVSGTLYLVATPIGNLQDMTFRAIEVLKEVSVIAAEDTRQTRKLLTHFQIEGPRLISYHEHNKSRMEDEILGYLKEGKDVALVSDAGTPGISDPGEEVVHAAANEGYRIVPIPGACAAIAALIVSGLPTNQFSFVGFLPRDRKDRKQELERWKARRETLVFYEAPHRLKDTLKDMREILGNRQITASRELTKRYEENARGRLEELVLMLETEPPKGEYVLVVEGAAEDEYLVKEDVWWESLTPAQHVEMLIIKGTTKKEAIKQAAKDRNLPKREVYQAVLEAELDNK